MESPEKKTIECLASGKWQEIEVACVRIDKEGQPIMNLSQENNTAQIGFYTIYGTSAVIFIIAFSVLLVIFCAK